MTVLLRGQSSVKTVFDLLGSKENDMTYGLGWCLARCEEFLKLFCEELGYQGEFTHCRIELQRFDLNATGYTDIEIVIPGEFACIIEAKKSYSLPSKDFQLQKYSKRKILESVKDASICVLSFFDESQIASQPDYFSKINDVPVLGMSWKSVIRLASRARKTTRNEDKRLLDQFISYLKGIVAMKDPYSNLVYVVSLGAGSAEGWKVSWKEIVFKRNIYFHPIGGTRGKNGRSGGWPTEPVNYLGFRYGGKLQSLRHVDRVETMTNLNAVLSEIPKRHDNHGLPHFVYHLGPEILPKDFELPMGAKWRANRVWCMIDTLLTCKSLSEAKELTKKRLGDMSSEL